MPASISKLIIDNLDNFYPEFAPVSQITIEQKPVLKIRIFSQTTDLFLFRVIFSDCNQIPWKKAILVKHKAKISSNEYKRMKVIWDSQKKIGNRKLIPRPLFQTTSCLITEFAGHIKLLYYLLPKMIIGTWRFHLPNLTNKIRRMAEWLGDYQKTQPLSKSEQIQPYIKYAYEQLDSSNRYLKNEKESIIRNIKELSSKIDRIPYVDNHGDFYFRNILFNRDQILLVDWESDPHRGNALLDLNCFLLNILSISRYPVFSKKVCIKLCKCFREKYFDEAPFKVSNELFQLTNILFMIQYLNDYDMKIGKWTPKHSYLNDIYMKWVQNLLLKGGTIF